MAIPVGVVFIANLMLGTSQVHKVFLGTKQVWADKVVIVLGNAASIVLQSYFSPEEWADLHLKKLAVVPVGVEIGATNGTYAIAPALSGAGQAGSWAGSLTLEVRGTISGIGGTANSGVGGSCIWGNLPGRNGELLNVIYFPGCTIRSGGGGGGRAGNGGAGVWYNHQDTGLMPWSGPTGGYSIESSTGYNKDFKIWWGGAALFWLSGYPTVPAAFDWGGYTYYPGAHMTSNGDWRGFQVGRRLTTPISNYTAGGVAPNAGRGQGYDGAASVGGNAVAGGTNAGASGKSGNGGAYGSAGTTGASGSTGNYTAGTAGAAPGLAGFYLHGAANCNITDNGGTLLGRTAA